MDTGNFNFLDKWIARWRMGQVLEYVGGGEEVLDFGCGVNGVFLGLISKKIKRGVGLDYEVENRKGGNLEFIKIRFDGELPLKNESFDLVFALAVIEHISVDKIKKFFEETERVLRKRGRLIITSPSIRGKKVLELLSGLGLISKAEVKDHKKYYGRNDMGWLTKMRLVRFKGFQMGLNNLYVFEKN